MKNELASIIVGMTGGLVGAGFWGMVLTLASTLVMAFFSAIFSYLGILAVKAIIKRYSKKKGAENATD